MPNPFLALLLGSLLGSPALQSGFFSPVLPPGAQYEVECTFDTTTALLQGSETISFRNTTSRPIERLALSWSLHPKKSLTVLAGGKPVTLLLPPGQTNVNGPLLLQLPEPLKPGSRLALKVEFHDSYAGQLDARHRLLLQGWFPQLWWGFATLDDYTVHINLSRGWGAVTSGVLDSASGLWRGKDIRSFAAFLFDGKQYVEEQAKAGDVTVTVVHTVAGAKCAQLVLQTAVDVIAFYRQRFGFYPHASLTLIPGMDYPAGGYPVATAMVAIHGEEQMDKKPEAHFLWITAHEIGHMYWSEYVFADGEDPLDWLMLGLGIFADREYRRARGIAPPVGNLPANYVGGVQDGFDTTMDLSDEQQELIEWDFNNVVQHGKSSAMMDALEATIGAAAFDRAYRRCLSEYHGRRMNWHDFRKICEDESGEDLGWFFDSWARTNQYSLYRITKQETVQTPAGGWRSEVQVVSKGTRTALVPVVATFADGSKQTQRTDRVTPVNLLVFRSPSPLKDVKLDPANALWMPESDPPLTAPDLERKILHMDLTGSGEEALPLLPRALQLHITNSEMWRHFGLLLYDAHRYQESLECFQQAAGNTSDKDYQFAALAWQGLLLDLLHRRDAAIQAYKAAQATTSQQLFRFDQYKLRIDQKWIEERLQTPFQPDSSQQH